VLRPTNWSPSYKEKQRLLSTQAIVEENSEAELEFGNVEEPPVLEIHRHVTFLPCKLQNRELSIEVSQSFETTPANSSRAKVITLPKKNALTKSLNDLKKAKAKE